MELELIPSPATGGVAGDLTPPRRDFNLLMFSTQVGGALEGSSSLTAFLLRPETAQGIFANFKNVREVSRAKVPFGIAQSLPHRDHAAQLHLPVPLSASKWRSSTSSSARATTSGRTGGSGSRTRAGGSFLSIGLREDLIYIPKLKRRLFIEGALLGSYLAF